MKLNKHGTKTYGCVSVAKKAMWRTSMLFKGITNPPFSTARISIHIYYALHICNPTY